MLFCFFLLQWKKNNKNNKKKISKENFFFNHEFSWKQGRMDKFMLLRDLPVRIKKKTVHYSTHLNSNSSLFLTNSFVPWFNKVLFPIIRTKHLLPCMFKLVLYFNYMVNLWKGIFLQLGNCFLPIFYYVICVSLLHRLYRFQVEFLWWNFILIYS